jgi:bacterioferritin (cytochrome b1)
MKASPEVMASLLAILAKEAHLNMQDRRDWRAVYKMGVKATAHKLKKFGTMAHKFQVIIADRILDLGGDTEYDCGSVVAGKTLTEIFKTEMALEDELATMCQAGIGTAVKAGDEATAEKLRHVEERHEDHVVWLEEQLTLIAGMTEPTYIAVHLKH